MTEEYPPETQNTAPNQTPATTTPVDVIINPAAGGIDGQAVPLPADTPKSQTTKNPAESQGGEVILNRVTTYQDAIKDALRSQSMSSASLLMAEERRRSQVQKEEEQTSLKTPKNRWLLAGAAALIALGLLILGFAFLSRDDGTSVDTQRSIVSRKFFDPDATINIASAQLTRNTILKLQQVLAGPMPRNTVQQLVITKEVRANPDSAFELTKAEPYTTDELLALLQARVDSSFGRSVDQDFFLGAHVTATNDTFLIFRIVNFDNVFAASFNWESSMARDLEAIFPQALGPVNKLPEPVAQAPAPIATTTSTSTQKSATTTAPLIPQVPQRTTAGLFSDQVLANSDARVIKDSSGNVLFFYTFIDEEYLYFGTKAQTLNEVKKRIRSAKLVI